MTEESPKFVARAFFRAKPEEVEGEEDGGADPASVYAEAQLS